MFARLVPAMSSVTRRWRAIGHMTLLSHRAQKRRGNQAVGRVGRREAPRGNQSQSLPQAPSALTSVQEHRCGAPCRCSGYARIKNLPWWMSQSTQTRHPPPWRNCSTTISIHHPRLRRACTNHRIERRSPTGELSISPRGQSPAPLDNSGAC
jgi:hypothetical protein